MQVLLQVATTHQVVVEAIVVHQQAHLMVEGVVAIMTVLIVGDGEVSEDVVAEGGIEEVLQNMMSSRKLVQVQFPLINSVVCVSF